MTLTGKKWARRIIPAGLLLIVGYFSFAGEYNLYTLWKLRRQEQALRHQIEDSEQTRRQLITEIEKLKNDSTYIEKIAREQFKMGRKGEKIYVFKSKSEK